LDAQWKFVKLDFKVLVLDRVSFVIDAIAHYLAGSTAAYVSFR